jgi:hypothetical protein
VALVNAGALLGCNAILGLDEVAPLDAVGAGGATAAGTGTASGAGGGSSTVGAGSGGAGGQGACDVSTLGTASGCERGQKCSIASLPDGPPGCVSAGNRPGWSACDVDAQCAVGTWCDLLHGVCRPVCNAGACAGDGSCVPAPDGGGGSVRGLQVCTSDCDPVSANPCSQAHGDVTCGRTIDGLDCVDSGGMTSRCSLDRDCAPGLACWNAAACYEWCVVGAGGGGCSCEGFEPPALSADGTVEYGFCSLI